MLVGLKESAASLNIRQYKLYFIYEHISIESGLTYGASLC